MADTSLSFSKLKPRKSYEHVVDQIQTAICDGELKQGDKLPSEMKLSAMFDTSRGTVREALRVLEQKGLVGIRTGVKGGATVKAANTDAMTDSIGLLIRHRQVSLGHLAEFRELLEGHAARQAAEMAGPGDIRALEAILADIRGIIDAGPDTWDEFHDQDARFHKALAGICGNPLLQANLDSIHRHIHTYFHQYLAFDPDLLASDFQDLCEITQAVAAGDGDTARKTAVRHVARFSELMEEAAS